ncbi:MAG: hypothetical protein ACK56I_15670, partial [bacterium]
MGLTGVPECPSASSCAAHLRWQHNRKHQGAGAWERAGRVGPRQERVMLVEPDRDRDAPLGGCSRQSGRAHTLHLCCPLAWATQTRYGPCPRLVSPGPGRSVSCWWSLT